MAGRSRPVLALAGAALAGLLVGCSLVTPPASGDNRVPQTSTAGGSGSGRIGGGPQGGRIVRIGGAPPGAAIPDQTGGTFAEWDALVQAQCFPQSRPCVNTAPSPADAPADWVVDRTKPSNGTLYSEIGDRTVTAFMRDPDGDTTTTTTPPPTTTQPPTDENGGENGGGNGGENGGENGGANNGGAEQGSP